MQAATAALSTTRRAFWSAAVSTCRAGIRAQGALAQDHISLLQRTLDDGLDRARSAAIPSTPLSLQMRSAGHLTDELLGIARIVADLQVRGASQALDWWEKQLEALWKGSEAKTAAVTPEAPASTPSDPSPSRSRAARIRGGTRSAGAGAARADRSRRKRRPD